MYSHRVPWLWLALVASVVILFACQQPVSQLSPTVTSTTLSSMSITPSITVRATSLPETPVPTLHATIPSMPSGSGNPPSEMTPSAESVRPLGSDRIEYIVGSGDTVEWLSIFFGVRQQQINNLSQPNASPNQLIPGDRLEILFNSYRVRENDVLGSIAYLFGVTVGVIQEENALADVNVIQPGDLLDIPGEPNVLSPTCSHSTLDIPVESTSVLTYTVYTRQDVLCLRGILTVAELLWANPNLLGPLRRAAEQNSEVGLEEWDVGLSIRIVPTHGTIYQVPARGASAVELAQQFDVPQANLLDWKGLPANPILLGGQSIFVVGVNLNRMPLYGTQSVVRVVSTSSSIGAPGNETGSVASFPRIGDEPAPDGALRPSSQYPWLRGPNIFDTGWCDYVVGYGWNGGLVWPVTGRSIRENHSFRPGHTAIDIDGEVGDPVYATATGVVTWAGFSSWGGGNIIALSHGNGWLTIYAHLNEVSVGCGQAVSQGGQIGTVGMSGDVTWAHLHLELHNGGYAYNPLDYLP